MFILDAIKGFFRNKNEQSKKGFRKVVLAAPFWVIIIGIVLLGIGITRSVILTHDRYDSRMNIIWAQGSDSKFRHVAVYAGGYRSMGDGSPLEYQDAEHSLKLTDITAIRTSLQSAVDTGNTSPNKTGLNSDGTPKGWEDCWSTWLEGTAVCNRDGYNSQLNADCQIIAVGGNFKVFHPFMYMSGGFLAEECTDPKQIVINDVLAWRFFSSYDVVGYKINVLGEDYVIAGVVAEPSSSIDKAAETNEPRVYMYYSNLATVFSSEENEVEIGIGCYEVMLPELVSGVAISDVKNALPSYSAEDPHFYIVSVTGRFFFTKVWGSIMPVGSTKLSSSFDLPYWEKAAELTTQHLFADMVMIILGAIFFIIGIIMIVLKIKKFVAQTNPDEGDDESEEDTAS